MPDAIAAASTEGAPFLLLVNQTDAMDSALASSASTASTGIRMSKDRMITPAYDKRHNDPLIRPAPSRLTLESSYDDGLRAVCP